MRNRLTIFAAGLLMALAVGVVAQQSTISGQASRLRLQSLGIGTAAPSTTGSLSALGNVNASLDLSVDNDSNGTGNAARITLSSGDANAALFTAGSGRTSTVVTNGPTGAQAVLRTLGNYPLVFGTDNTERVRIAGDGGATFTAAVDTGAVRAESNVPVIGWYESDASATNRYWRLTANAEQFLAQARGDDGSGGSSWLTVDRTGTTVDTINLAATAVQTNGINITAANGTFTCTLTGYAANPSGTCNWSKTGNRVTIYSAASINGTSNATTMTMTGLPAALAPVNAQEAVIEGCRDNGVVDLICSGNLGAAATTITLGRVTVSGSNLVAFSSWTGSGSKGIEAGWSFSYVLD
jgi:hypothetical protein